MFKDWTKFEKWWLAVFTALILGATCYFSWGGTDYTSTESILLNWVISPVSALTGIVCVVLCAKGKLSNYVWGVVNCITYGYVAYRSGYYGDAIINVFYCLPFQFIGYVWWKNHLKEKSSSDVKMRTMNWKQALITTVLGVGFTLLIGLGLFQIDHWFVEVMKRNVSIYTYIDGTFGIPLLGAVFDASTEVLHIIAQILMTVAFAEQWILWIVIDVITSIMWGTVLVADPTSYAWALPTLIMWIAYLVNAVYGWINWKKGAKENA